MSIKPLLKGESAIEGAPVVHLDNGACCIPLHYLAYQHDLDSVSQVLLDIHYDKHFPLFACEDESGLFIQVGIIGLDNYQTNSQGKQKIVYGRKWRVEPQLPTSEIIQTAFLALKKAREHEVRELLLLKQSATVSTPFNNHHDLPLMAKNQELVKYQCQGQVTMRELSQLLAQLEFAQGRFLLSDVTQHKQLTLLDIVVTDVDHARVGVTVPESFTLVLTQMCPNEMLYELMKFLVDLTVRHVEEHFVYQGFKRFSRQVSVQQLGLLSNTLRNTKPLSQNKAFTNNLLQSNYDTDVTRAPHITHGKLADKLKQQLAEFGELEGIAPVFYSKPLELVG